MDDLLTGKLTTPLIGRNFDRSEHKYIHTCTYNLHCVCVSEREREFLSNASVSVYQFHSYGLGWPGAVIEDIYSKHHSVELNPEFYFCSFFFYDIIKI